MAKEFELNDNVAQDQERQRQQQSDDKRNQQNVPGKALQMNDKSAGGKGPPALPRRGSSGKPNQQKLQGKALQVNENSVEDQGAGREP